MFRQSPTLRQYTTVLLFSLRQFSLGGQVTNKVACGPTWKTKAQTESDPVLILILISWSRNRFNQYRKYDYNTTFCIKRRSIGIFGINTLPKRPVQESFWAVSHVERNGMEMADLDETKPLVFHTT